MTRRTRWLLLAAVVMVPFEIWAGWYEYTRYHERQFTQKLDLIAFSTSMIGGPRPGSEQEAFERAAELRIDLFRTYRRNLFDGPRFSLAWMLISQESPEYFEFATKNVDSIPWPEARMCCRCGDEKLSEETRDQLQVLLLSSPTSEAKLFAASWYAKRGRLIESEDAYYDAMTKGLFWDALDAANALRESERYRDDAVRHFLTVARDGEHFTWRAAMSLLIIYNVREELAPLVEASKKERRDGPNRKALVEKLTALVEKDRDS